MCWVSNVATASGVGTDVPYVDPIRAVLYARSASTTSGMTADLTPVPPAMISVTTTHGGDLTSVPPVTTVMILDPTDSRPAQIRIRYSSLSPVYLDIRTSTSLHSSGSSSVTSAQVPLHPSQNVTLPNPVRSAIL